MSLKRFERRSQALRWLPVLGSGVLCASMSYAADVDSATFQPTSAQACAGVVGDSDRLACYDRAE